MGQAAADLPRYPPICTTSPELLSSRRGLLQLSACPEGGPQAPAPTQTRLAGNAHLGVDSNAARNFPPRPTQEFAPIPMTYNDLLPSIIANQMAVISPGKIFQPPFPRWYNPNATSTYHGKTPGHSAEQFVALKHKVQSLIEAGWLTFQEDRPNVKTNSTEQCVALNRTMNVEERSRIFT